MKKFNLLILLIFSFSVFPQTNTDKKSVKKTKKLIPFTFKDKKLSQIIDFLSKKKKVNYILPQRKAEAEEFEKQTVTFSTRDKKNISVDKAWELATLFLELSGYSWFEKNKNLYQIVKIGKKGEAGITQEPLPLYININPQYLPSTSKRIRYVLYLANLELSDRSDIKKSLDQIIKDISSEGAPEPIYLEKSNGIILVDKTDIVASIATIISELDKTGFREVIEVIQLNNVAAQEFSDIFKKIKLAAGDTPTSPFIRTQSKALVSYFAEDTQIITNPQNNQLILMGRQTAIDRIKEFINDYDKPPESGKSILHYYDLQYLDAENFARILDDIIKTPSTVRQADQAFASGNQRVFKGAQVKAEPTKIIQPPKLDNGPSITEPRFTTNNQGQSPLITPELIQGVYSGGNRLIIAATEDDWLEIKDLITKLDKPQPQVIIEVLIVDFTHNRDKLLSGSIRNRELTDLPSKGIDFLSSHITPVNNVLGATPKSLSEDLLQILGSTTSQPQSVTNLINPGSLLLSFNDKSSFSSQKDDSSSTLLPGGVFGLINVLNTFLNTKIISHPYLVSTNNKKATVLQEVIKRARGNAQTGNAGAIVVDIEDLSAAIQVEIIPRISSAQRLSMQISVDINEFISPTSLDRITRRVETNANLNTGEILVIGGLTRLRSEDSKTSWPLLSKIPFFGNFFKGTIKRLSTSNLGIFISPTIIHPKRREGLDQYTEDKIRKSRRDIDERVVFGHTKDPITYLYFPNSKQDNDDLLKEYLDDTINAPEFQAIKTTKEKKLEKQITRIKKTKKQKIIPLKKDKKLKEIPA